MYLASRYMSLEGVVHVSLDVVHVSLDMVHVSRGEVHVSRGEVHVFRGVVLVSGDVVHEFVMCFETGSIYFKAWYINL